MSQWSANRAFKGIVVVAFMAIWLAMSQFNRPPFELAKLDELSIGMTQNSVREVLGTPAMVYGDKNDLWVYKRLFAWPMVNVEFDENGRLSRFAYDY